MTLVSVHKINKYDMQNTYAVYGVELNAQNFLLSHKHTHKRLCHSKAASLMTLFKTMPDIDEMLLQLIDVMKLIDLLLHLLPILQWVHICAVGWPKVW